MRALPLAFTGSADDLRRHTRRDRIVNLLLTGLYTSIVRRRTAQYLAAHTTLDGSPIERVAVRKSRWPAILLVIAFLAARVANELGAGPPLPLVIVAGVLMLPYLWASVAARELAGWRWRDAQLAFTATWRETYAASWPLLVLGGAWALVQPQVADAGTVQAAWVAAGVLVAFPLVAVLAFNYRKLRFTRTCAGSLPVRWNAQLASYLRLWAVTAVAILMTAVAPVLLLRHALFGPLTLEGPGAVQGWIIYSVALLLVVLLAAPARAWYEARVFALSWDGLRVGDAVQVTCTLDVRAFVRLRTRGTWAAVLTCGVAGGGTAVRVHRAKIASLHVAQRAA